MKKSSHGLARWAPSDGQLSKWPTFTLNRRQWMTGTLALIAAELEGACRSTPGPTPSSNAGTGDAGGTYSVATDFDRWQNLLDALRHSPDHLEAQADAAVATKDARVIFAFVRDNIATVPPLSAVESIETAVRFGVGNLLRSGVGTPRERAELLVSLLARAGFSASVVKGDPAGPLFASDAPRVVYLRNIKRAFEPAPPPSGTWLDPLPDGTPDPIIVDSGGRDSQALFDKLRPIIPTNVTVRTPYLGLLSSMPLVALKQAGTSYLNPLLPDAEYGQSYATNIAPAAVVATTRQVLVRLSATRARAVADPITLVEGTFGYDELAGSRLRVTPQPTLSLPTFLAAKPLDVNNFVTGLALVGAKGVLKRFVPGVAIGAAGDVIQVGTASTSVNGVPQVTGGDPSTITQLTAIASSARDPLIELQVAPTDANGNVVTGLPASAFVVEEDGVRVSAVLRENGGVPRVLLFWDTSGSQPAVTDAIAQGIAAALFSAIPNAAVQLTSIDGSPSVDGFLLTTAGAVKQALLSLAGGTTSPIYAGLLSAFAAAPTLVVMFTDGDAEKSPGLAAQCLAAAGTCAIVAIGCHGASATTLPDALTALTAASGGQFVDGGDLSDLTQVTDSIHAVGAPKSSRPYRLVYVSRGGAGKHAVRVTAGTASATAEYTLASGATSTGYSEFVGIHLHLEMDGQVVERTLVGLPPLALPDDVDASAELLAAGQAARDFFLSSTWISFEGSAPTLSAWLDDSLTAAIGWKPVQDAVDKGDVQAAYAALAEAPTRSLSRSLLAHAPLPQPSSAVVSEYALRAAVHMLLPLSRRTSVDLLPSTRFLALGTDDGALAFDQSMRATLGLAVAEAAMAKGSTLQQLANAPLQALALGLIDPSALTGFQQSQRTSMAALLNRYSSSYRIVAADGSTTAFWSIDAASGTALGILPDGTGGAIESCLEIVEWANSRIDELGLLVAEIDSGLAPTFTFIAAVGKAASVAVAEAALSFTDPLIDPSIWQLGLTIACSIESDLIGNSLPGAEPGFALGNIAMGWIKNRAAGEITDANPGCKAVAPCSPKG